jgi:hypothetical protein
MMMTSGLSRDFEDSIRPAEFDVLVSTAPMSPLVSADLEEVPKTKR